MRVTATGKLGADLCPLLSTAESMQGTVKGENRPEGGANVYAHAAETVIIYRNPLIDLQSL